LHCECSVRGGILGEEYTRKYPMAMDQSDCWILGKSSNGPKRHARILKSKLPLTFNGGQEKVIIEQTDLFRHLHTKGAQYSIIHEVLLAMDGVLEKWKEDPLLY
jgi:hypothetical protein